MAVSAQQQPTQPTAAGLARLGEVTPAATYGARVERVIDGDTIVMLLAFRTAGLAPALTARHVRLRDVKAPELRDEGGPDARDELAAWCTNHATADGWLKVTSYIAGNRPWHPMAPEAMSFERLVGDVHDVRTGELAGVHMVTAGHSRPLLVGSTTR
jgi:hypothetical protein